MKKALYILILLAFSSQAQTVIADYSAKSPFYTTTTYTTACTTTGQNIGFWADASGNGYTATVSSTPPTYSLNGGPNGQKAIAFNGTNEYLTTPAFINSTFNNGFAIFIIAKGVANASAQIPVGGQNNCFYDYHNYSNDNQSIVFGNLSASGSGKYPIRYNDTAFIEGIAYRPNYQGPLTSLTDSGFFYFYQGTQSGFMMQNNDGYLNNCSGSLCNISSLHKFISNPTQTDAIQIGSAYGGGSYWAGTISEIIIIQGICSNVYIRNEITQLANTWGFALKKMCVWSGNSLVSGTNSNSGATQTCRPTGNNAPAYCWINLDSTKFDVRTDAYPGRTLYQMINEEGYFSNMYINPNTDNIDVCWEIVNTLSYNHSPTATENLLKQFCQMRQTLGFKEVVVTCIARGTTGVYAGFNNDRDSVNAWILKNYTSFASAVFNPAAESIFSQPVTSTYYGSDSLHLTSRGYDSIGIQCARIILTNNL